MKKLFFTLALSTFVSLSFAQNVGINTTGATPNPSAALDIDYTNKGLLIPRVSLTSTTDIITVPAPATSLLVYNTNVLMTGGAVGYWYWDGAAWIQAIGPAGPQGPIGPAGANGTNGTNGLNGATGPQGPIGPTGPAGANGTNGTNGLNGATGPQGPIGPTGLAGANGTNGTNGLNGATGPQGPIGPTGANGTNGTNGLNGATGPQGPIGPTGVNGLAGATGATGPTGTFTTNAWLILGNSGTTPATNFVGTTDNQSFVTRTNNTERMRVLNTGQVVINNTLSFGSNSVLSSYAAVADRAISASANSANNSIHSQQTGTGRGLFAGVFNPASTTAAIQGQTDGNIGIGVSGFHTGTGAGLGTYGQSTSATGVGVYGVNTSLVSTAIGTVGQTVGDGIGVLGFSTAVGTSPGIGVAGDAIGTRGMGGMFTSGNATGTALITGGNNIPTMYYLTTGTGGAFNGIDYGLYGFAHGGNTTASAGGYFRDSVSAAQDVVVRVAAYVTGTQYKIIGTGTVSTIVSDNNNNDKIMFASEAPEVLFEDYGKGQLVNGAAKITLDPTFAKNITVNSKHELRVFIQLEGDCNGVYVANKTANGFEVKELAGGSSNVKFSYHVIGNRADAYVNGQLSSKYEDLRYPEAPKNEENSMKNKKEFPTAKVSDTIEAKENK